MADAAAATDVVVVVVAMFAVAVAAAAGVDTVVAAVGLNSCQLACLLAQYSQSFSLSLSLSKGRMIEIWLVDLAY